MSFAGVELADVKLTDPESSAGASTVSENKRQGEPPAFEGEGRPSFTYPMTFASSRYNIKVGTRLGHASSFDGWNRAKNEFDVEKVFRDRYIVELPEGEGANGVLKR